MKKIIIILLIILTSLGCSNNLDKYESKRVFDKSVDYIINGNYEKYKNDIEMERVLDSQVEKELDVMRPYLKDKIFEVIEVKEKGEQSILKVKVSYISYNVTKESFEGFDKKFEINENWTEKEYAENYFKKFQLEFKDKSIIKNKTIEISMFKTKGRWEFKENNEDFFEVMYSFYYELFSQVGFN